MTPKMYYAVRHWAEYEKFMKRRYQLWPNTPHYCARTSASGPKR